MATGITKTSTLTDTIPTIIEKARMTEQFKSVMAPLCWQIPKKLHDGSTVNVPYFGTVTASALTEGVDMAYPQAMADTTVTITPAEVGCQILVTDKLVRDDKEDIIGVAGEILGAAMAVKRDVDLTTQLDDGTTSLGSGSTMTLGYIAAAHALLGGLAVTSGGPCPGPYTYIVHPYTYLDFVDVVTPLVPSTSVAYATPMSDEWIANYWKGKLFNINIVEDGNLVIASSNTKGGVIGPRSLILSTAKEWGVEEERDASLRATELNIVGEYGCGEYLAGWIVEMYADTTTPG
jgi:hypothetical protein